MVLRLLINFAFVFAGVNKIVYLCRRKHYYVAKQHIAFTAILTQYKRGPSAGTSFFLVSAGGGRSLVLGVCFCIVG